MVVEKDLNRKSGTVLTRGGLGIGLGHFPGDLFQAFPTRKRN